MVTYRAAFAIGTVYGLFAALVSYVFTLHTGRSLWTLDADASTSWPYVLAINLIFWNAWAVLVPSVVALADRMRIEGPGWKRAFAGHVAAGIAFTGAHVLIVSTARFAMQRALHIDILWGPLVVQDFLRTLDWEMAVYWAAVGLSHAVRYQREARDRAVRAAHLETRLVEARLEALQRQLQPHFLFNTLHAVNALNVEAPAAAARMVAQLSALLRATFATDAGQETTLEAELQHLNTYLDIQRVHFGDRLRVSLDIGADARAALVPALLLQPIVENAIRHGLAPRARGGSIVIRARRVADNLELEVADDGVGLRRDVDAAGASGIGLRNTRARLEALYGERHRLDLVPRADGFTVRLVVPFRTPADAVEACA